VFLAARDGVRRLSQTLARIGASRARTGLPNPTRSFDVEDVTIIAPESQTAIVAQVRFKLVAGDVLGVVGPSGSGKTSLVRVLAGIWPPARGSVRVDGAALDQWLPQVLGPHVGYLAQAVELFDGTVAENIARMAAEPDADAVVHAAKMAGAHDMILRLSNGYDTHIGDSGVILSAGQRQRVALARALYGDPFVILLDEPKANLDSAGEKALLQAIRNAKARGAIVVMIAHRTGALAVCDKVLVLRDGVQQALGPRDEVLGRMARPNPQLMPAAAHPIAASLSANLKIVGEASGGGG
jgi:ATP-binding cassette subfamily C protein